VYSLFIAPHNQLGGCVAYTNPGHLSQEIFLRLLFEKEPVLAQPYLNYEVVIGEPPFLLIPEALRSPAHHLAMARLGIDDAVLAEELHTAPSLTDDLYALFGMPAHLRYVLDHYVVHYQLSHVALYAIQTAHRLATDEGNTLLLTALPGRVIITALREGKLQLCNSYRCSSALEQIYFLQSVRRVTGLSAAHCLIYAQGEVAPRSEDPEGLFRQLPGLHLPPPQLLTQRDLPDEAHPWRYAFLK